MPQQINLYNPDLAPRPLMFSAIGMAQTLVVMMIGMLLIQGYGLYTQAQTEQYNAQMAKLLASEKASLERLHKGSGRSLHDAQLEAEVKQWEVDLKTRQEAITLLQSQQHRGDRGGFSPLFSALARQIVEGVWITGVAIGPQREIALTGRAINAERVPLYFQRLKNEPALRGHTFDQFEIVPGATVQGRALPYIEFRLGVWPKGGADEAPSAAAR